MELIKVNIQSIYDGDTLTVNPIGVPNRFNEVLSAIKLRVSGVNTPEKRGGSDLEKKLDSIIVDFLKETIKGSKKIEIDLDGKLSFGRFHADLYFDGVSWAETLIEKRYGVRYDGEYSVKDFNWDLFIKKNHKNII